jgi:hypothetical protein
MRAKTWGSLKLTVSQHLRLRLTRACRRPPIASAALRLLAAPEAERSAEI